MPLLQLPTFFTTASAYCPLHPSVFFFRLDTLRRVVVYPPRYNPSMLLRLCYNYPLRSL